MAARVRTTALDAGPPLGHGRLITTARLARRPPPSCSYSWMSGHDKNGLRGLLEVVGGKTQLTEVGQTYLSL